MSRPRVSALTDGPKVPIAEFERLKETSPAKKAKLHETVLHTVDIKSVRCVYDPLLPVCMLNGC